MDNRNDLQEALDALSVGSLTYLEWLQVGMGLKQAGYSVSDWETWSASDPDRYHAGECEKKWKSFRGDTSTPITENTIFKIAFDHGWRGSSGHELDWEDSIAVDSAASDGIIVDKHWVEDREVTVPDDWNPADQLTRYLQALFEPTETVGYVVESWNKDGRWLPNQGHWDRTAGQLIEQLSDCGGDIGQVLGDYNPDAGAWIRFNPLDGNGCKNDNVTEFRYALVESDGLEIEKQNAIIHQLELPCAALVFSGGKSLHAIVRVDAPDYAEYRRRVDYLYNVCQKNGLVLDQACRNPSRLSRMPGATRAGVKQCLIETNFGRANWDTWKDWIESSADDLPDTESLAAEWDNMPPLADSLIDGVLRQGHKMLIAGPPKAGKSFALIELCISIAEGLRWLGRFGCACGKVLYINLELDRASCLHRFKDVYAALGARPEHLSSIDIWNLRGTSCPMDKLAPKLIRRASKKGYIAVVLDPIYKVITGDENSADQMARFCNQFDLVCKELGCAVIYCHHHSKGAQGGKRSMDRASGSGVFARDPDAMLDMTELEPTEAIRTQLENRATCSVCIDALRNSGHSDVFSQDDALSKTQMLAHCREHLGTADLRRIDAAAAEARQHADKLTAWRIEGTLREFASFDPVNLWFDYPIHKVDDGLLEDLQPDTDMKSLGKRGAAKRWSKNPEEKARISLANAFEACMMDGQVTVYSLAQYMDLKAATVKRRLKTDGGYWIDGEVVGKKEPGSSG